MHKAIKATEISNLQTTEDTQQMHEQKAVEN